MQKHSVPLLQPEAPLIGTGFEKPTARTLGMTPLTVNCGKGLQINKIKFSMQTRISFTKLNKPNLGKTMSLYGGCTKSKH